MAKKEAIGYMACPECGFPDAEIKHDKNGKLYRYCPDCSAQYMTHGKGNKETNLRARMRPIAAAVEAVVEELAGAGQVEKASKQAGRFLL